MKVIIATIKSWNVENAKKLIQKYKYEHEIMLIDKQEEFTADIIEQFNPDIIFFPHWSYIIPESIFETRKCIVFHMTDLPFGRGGSPLQNLIVRGITETKISALKVEKEIDAGPIFMKEELSLEGSATQIFQRASNIIFEKMIPTFLVKELEPKAQVGEVICFKRRKAEDGEIKVGMDIGTVYDYIRMLDAEGYPNAYINVGNLKFAFKNAVRKGNKVFAEVEITEDEV